MILALALGGFGIGTTEFVAMGLLPDIASSLSISEPTAGHLISAYALGVVIGAPLITAIAAKVSRRRLLIWLMVAFTANTLSVLAPTTRRCWPRGSSRVCRTARTSGWPPWWPRTSRLRGSAPDRSAT